LQNRGEVLIAEEQAALRQLYGCNLRDAGFTVVEVGSADEATRALAEKHFDVLILDIDMLGDSWLQPLRFVREGELSVSVVLMTAKPALETAVLAIRHGALDYVTKPLELRSLVPRLEEAIRKGRASRGWADVRRVASEFAASVASIETALVSLGQPSPAARQLQDGTLDPLARMVSDDVERLSPREREVAHLLAQGKAVGDVASALDLSPNTVRNHVKSVFVKLRIHSQVELLSRVAGHGR
jgi:DNA-binding NarL/FixJ family response regulator